jgi:hypothetical protein
MPATMTAVAEALKEVYLDRIRDQLQSRIKTLSRITRSSDNISHTTGGKYVRFATRIRRNHAIGARLEREALPQALSNKYKDAQVPLKYLYGSIDLTGQMFELATENPQAFADLVKEEVNGLTEGLKKDFNRQVYGTNTGILVVAVTGSTTTLVNTGTNALQYMEVGMRVDVIDSDGTTVNNAGVYVTNVNKTTGTVTLSQTIDGAVALTVAVAVNDFLVRAGSLGKEITGFSQFIDSTGSVYNIDASTTPVWASSEIAVGGALSEGVMIQLADRIYTDGGDNISAGFCSLGVRRAYFQLLAQERQHVNTTKFTGGFSGLAFTTDEGDIPIVHDVDCQPGSLYFVSEKELTLFEPQDWDWMDRDGSMWQRVITSAGTLDAYEATMFKYCELATTRRNAHGKLTGVTEPAA